MAARHRTPRAEHAHGYRAVVETHEANGGILYSDFSYYNPVTLCIIGLVEKSSVRGTSPSYTTV